MTQSLQQQRLAMGLCPSCGAQAAPYYLCDYCRFGTLIRRVLKKGVQAGTFQSHRDETDHRKQLYGIKNKDIPFKYQEALENDKRLAPRLKNIPIDVERELYQLFRQENRPLTKDEIYEAWGTLRLRSGRTSAVKDLVTIIKAQRKRARRAHQAIPLAPQET